MSPAPQTDPGQIQPASGSNSGMTAKSSWRIRAGAPTGGALRRIARFEVTGALGKGAFGEVWRAYDPNLDREVALKVPRFDDATGKEAERFFREARAAAQLHHPNIVAIHDAGDSDGQFYIASELIEGMPLSVWLKENTPTFEQTAQIIRKLAEALHYAHTQGIFHRDIKPANVMISSVASGRKGSGDGEAGSESETPSAAESEPYSPLPRTRGRGVGGEGDNEPHLMDFGLARRPDQEATMTMDGALVGTPSYMSPEQAGGKGRQADARSDIYSLGVVLYEMLVGRKPFDGPPPVVMHKILTEEPEPLRKNNAKVPRDLETICLKCLAKEPERRYPSAQHMAEELQRWMTGEPIQARPIKTPERLWRWCRRNPLVAGLTAAVAAALVVGTIVSVYFAIEATERAKEAIKEKLQGDHEVYVADMRLAQYAWERNNLANVYKLIMSHVPKKAGDVDWRGFEWGYWHHVCHNGRVILAGSEKPIGELLFAPSGKAVAGACEDGTVRVWDPVSGAQLVCLRGHKGAVTGIDFSRDGLRIASVAEDGLRLWDWQTGTFVHQEPIGAQGSSFSGGGVAGAVKFLERDSELAFVTKSEIIGWDSASKKKLWSIPIGIRELAFFSPRRDLLAVNSQPKNQIQIWDLKQQKLVRTLEPYGWAVAFSPDSQFLALGRSGAVLIWNLGSGKLVKTLSAKGWNTGVAYSPDGRRIAAAADDHMIRIWDARNGEILRAFNGFGSNPHLVAFSPDSSQIVSNSDVGIGVVTDLKASNSQLSLAGHRGLIWSVDVSPDGQYAASCGHDPLIRIWDVSAGKEVMTLEGGRGGATCVAFRPRANQLAALYSDDQSAQGQVQIWDWRSGKKVWSHPLGKINWGVSYSRDGTYVAAASEDLALATIWNADTGEEIQTIRGHGDGVFSAIFSPDGTHIVTTGVNGNVKLWRLEDGREIREYRGHVSWVPHADFSPDGKLLATASWDRSARIWDVGTGRLIHELRGHDNVVTRAIFSRDGRRVFTCSNDATVRVWDVELGKEILSIPTHPNEISALALSPDGSFLVSGSHDKLVRVWRSSPFQPAKNQQGRWKLEPAGNKTGAGTAGKESLNPGRTSKIDVVPSEYRRTWRIPQSKATLDDTLFLGRSHGDVTFEKLEKGWQVSIPPDKDNRDRFGRVYLPIAEGDFEITVTYQALVFPVPTRSGSTHNKIALGVKSVMGTKTAIWQRTHEPGNGAQSMAFYDPEGGRMELLPTATGDIERIRVTRHLDDLKAEWAAGDTATFREVGRLRFDRAAALPYLELASQFTGDEAKMTIKDVVIRAEGVEPGLWAEPQKATTAFVDDFTGALSPIRYKFTPSPLSKLNPGDKGLRVELDTTSLEKPTAQGQDYIAQLALPADFDATLTLTDLALPKPRLENTSNGIRLVLSNRKNDWLDVMRQTDLGNRTAFWFRRIGPEVNMHVPVVTDDLTECRLRLLRHGSYVYGFAGKGLAGPIELVGMAEWKEEATDLSVSLFTWMTNDKVAATLKRLEIKVPSSSKEKEKQVPAKAAKEITNSIGMKLVELPAGRFMMGSPANEAGRRGDEAQFEVTLTKPFAMGVHEVTIGQFRKFVEATGYKTEGERDGKGGDQFDFKGDLKINWQNPGWKPSEDHPVVCVSHNDAVAFCKWLTEKEKKNYRLPTEAEWEYACRAGSSTPYFFGDHAWDLQEYAVCALDRKLGPQKVGSLQPNQWGLYDMLGNASEWCSDYHGPYPKGAAKDPRGPDSGANRVIRGGVYHWDGPAFFRSAYRPGPRESSHRGVSVGFRVVMEIQ